MTDSSPTFAAQSANWTQAQKSLYQAKVKHYNALRQAIVSRQTGATTGVSNYACYEFCPPNYYLLGTPIYQEPGGTSGCWCGPASAQMVLWSFGYGSGYPTQGDLAVKAGTNCTSGGTGRPGLVNAVMYYQNSNPYVWGNISYNSTQGPIDVLARAQTDIGGYHWPLIYNILTYSPASYTGYPYYEGGHGSPLWRWPYPWRVWHYFTGVGYRADWSQLTVNDPAWATQDTYTASAVWMAIDNIANTDQVMW